jgi:ABC-2 type transport system ATP-binding protein
MSDTFATLGAGMAVRFRGVSKRYPHFALSDVSFDLPAGRIMGFIGANGAGKSTTLRILMGLVHQDRGAVEVLGRAMPDEGVAAKWDVGFVAEDMRLYPTATIGWHMAFVRDIYPGWDQRYADELVRRFDLRPAQRVKGLSHGQRIKAVLLLALARRPRLLVLDEPTAGLDPVARQEVVGALAEAVQDEGRTVLFSSQNTQDVEQVADQVTFIDRGRIVDADDKEQYLDRWRRLRLELPEPAALPALSGVVQRTVSGRVATLTTDRFDPALVSACEAAGATVHAIDRMTLEEIFVATVMARREEVPA